MEIYDSPKREAQIKINIFDLKKQNGYSLYVQLGLISKNAATHHRVAAFRLKRDIQKVYFTTTL